MGLNDADEDCTEERLPLNDAKLILTSLDEDTVTLMVSTSLTLDVSLMLLDRFNSLSLPLSVSDLI